MRIIAGVLGGRRLHAPKGQDTRPTADRVKEALFNILGAPPPPEERAQPFRVLDLFAGSGALGLEALSRGADEAVLVDEAKPAVEAAERNVRDLALEARVTIVKRDVGDALRRLSGRFDWVFIDPPYQGGALDRALRLLGSGALLDGETRVIAEHAAREPPADRYGKLEREETRRYGQTEISFYRVTTP